MYATDPQVTNGEPVLPRLFPVDVATAEGTPATLQHPLHPDERACASDWADARRGDFVVGRACARKALAALGIEGVAILPGPDRLPAWPEGFVGAISHTRGYAGAAVASNRRYRSLGLDIERCDRLKSATYRRIATPEELAWLHRQPADLLPRWAALVFSAKECFYKCQYPLTRAYLGFQDVEVHVDPAEGLFAVAQCPLLPALAEAAHRLVGRFAFHPPFVFTAMALPVA